MARNRPRRLVFFGSGAFGLPTLKRLTENHAVTLVVTQPDRLAGRNRVLTPTPIAGFARGAGLEVFKPDDPNDAEAIDRIGRTAAEVFVIIAYGHKLSEALIEGAHLAINLHGSLLPKYRGAAPVQWAVINNELETGVSVITLAQTMDAGAILGQARTPIDPMETAGELHDRLAELGPDLVEQVLAEDEAGTLKPRAQEESQACRAPKLSKEDGFVSFDQSAELVRARIHGLTPWPGCTVRLGDRSLKVQRVIAETSEFARPPGRLIEGGLITCSPGAVRLIEVQPPGGRTMTFEAFARGHSIPVGEKCEST